MAYELKERDHLELWMRFQGRADSVKEAMFKTLTWLVGYAAALLGFIFVSLANHDATKATISLFSIVALAGAAGLVICLYSWFALSESAKHIESNWRQADRCLEQVDGLKAIVRGADSKTAKTMKIWNQLRVIVALFALAFGATLAWSIAKP